MSDWRDEYLETNRASWDERVPIHAEGEFYDVAAFKEGQERLRPFELREVGDVSGKDLLHLQCHFGIDTLSWARRGARVVGLDFSAPAVERASELAAELGLDAEFVRSDVYEAVDALGGRDFDVVYTGLGALNWLPDIRRWSRVVAELVRPGGFLYLAEFHPITWVFGDEDLTLAHDYFQGEEPAVWDEPGTYADFEAQTVHNKTYEWNHTLGDVVSAVVEAGLVLELLHEHDYTLFPPLALSGEVRLRHLPAARRHAQATAHVLVASAETALAARGLPAVGSSQHAQAKALARQHASGLWQGPRLSARFGLTASLSASFSSDLPRRASRGRFGWRVGSRPRTTC